MLGASGSGNGGGLWSTARWCSSQTACRTGHAGYWPTTARCPTAGRPHRLPPRTLNTQVPQMLTPRGSHIRSMYGQAA